MENSAKIYCVDLRESFQTNMWLQKSASIQPRRSPVKFDGSSVRAGMEPMRRGPTPRCSAGGFGRWPMRTAMRSCSSAPVYGRGGADCGPSRGANGIFTTGVPVSQIPVRIFFAPVFSTFPSFFLENFPNYFLKNFAAKYTDFLQSSRISCK